MGRRWKAAWIYQNTLWIGFLTEHHFSLLYSHEGISFELWDFGLDVMYD